MKKLKKYQYGHKFWHLWKDNRDIYYKVGKKVRLHII